MRVEDARRRAREDVANHAAERAGEDAARDGDQRVSAAVEHALARCGWVGGDAWKETIGERGAILDDMADRVAVAVRAAKVRTLLAPTTANVPIPIASSQFMTLRASRRFTIFPSINGHAANVTAAATTAMRK